MNEEKRCVGCARIIHLASTPTEVSNIGRDDDHFCGEYIIKDGKYYWHSVCYFTFNDQ